MGELTRQASGAPTWSDARRPGAGTVIATANPAYARAAIRWLLSGVLLGSMSALWWYFEYRPDWEPGTLTVLAFVVTAVGGSLVLLSPGLHPLGFVGVYGIYLALAHLGAVGAILVTDDAFESFRPWQLLWFQSPERPRAVALAGIGIGSLALGALLASTLTGRARRPPKLQQRSWDGIYLVGMGLLSFGALYMLLLAVTRRLPILGSYRDYRQAMGEISLYPMTLFALATGLALTTATGDGRQRRWAMLIFAVPAILLAVSGNRGEVLFPAAAALAVYSVRGYKFRLKAVAAASVVFFLFIPIASAVRTTGLSEVELEQLSVRWTDPFVTNGWTLRPLTHTVAWIEGGEEHAWGRTYLLPLQQIASRLTPFVTSPSYQTDPHYIKDRLPGQGYSVVAEAFYNFGMPGTVLILAVIGALLTALGDRSTSALSLSLAGGISAVLVNNVRNHALFVPGQVLLVIACWTAGILLTLLMREADLRRRTGAARPSSRVSLLARRRLANLRSTAD
jgi:oligosaccharide repeat unit polymerase